MFKLKHNVCYATVSELGMVSACLVGDIMNIGRNHVVAINTEGGLYIFDCATESVDQHEKEDQDDPQGQIDAKEQSGSLNVVYKQRMPANCKDLLLADLDGDGQNELIVGLTDRVLRTYRWVEVGPQQGKFIGIYKWEFADQIGAVSLNPSVHKDCCDIIVAQPGGTYAKLECFDKKPLVINSNLNQNTTAGSHEDDSQADRNTTSDNDNVKTEYVSKLTPEYHQLALQQMRNHQISTEVLGGIRAGKNSRSYSLIVLATLDGTLMLVDKDKITWQLQVDHQLFALSLLESRPSSETSINRPHVANAEVSQFFAICAWNGKTYIVDEDRNYLRFKFDEAVSAFTAGNYFFDAQEHASLVYATFNNQIILYYDVITDQIRPMYMLEEITTNPAHDDLLKKIRSLADKLGYSPVGQSKAPNDDEQSELRRIKLLIEDILYGVTELDLQ